MTETIVLNLFVTYICGCSMSWLFVVCRKNEMKKYLNPKKIFFTALAREEWVAWDLVRKKMDLVCNTKKIWCDQKKIGIPFPPILVDDGLIPWIRHFRYSFRKNVWQRKDIDVWPLRTYYLTTLKSLPRQPFFFKCLINGWVRWHR